MNEQEFVKLCKKVVSDYANSHLDKSDHKQISEADVFNCMAVQDAPE